MEETYQFRNINVQAFKNSCDISDINASRLMKGLPHFDVFTEPVDKDASIPSKNNTHGEAKSREKGIKSDHSQYVTRHPVLPNVSQKNSAMSEKQQKLTSAVLKILNDENFDAWSAEEKCEVAKTIFSQTQLQIMGAESLHNADDVNTPSLIDPELNNDSDELCFTGNTHNPTQEPNVFEFEYLLPNTPTCTNPEVQLHPSSDEGNCQFIIGNYSIPSNAPSYPNQTVQNVTSNVTENRTLTVKDNVFDDTSYLQQQIANIKMPQSTVMRSISFDDNSSYCTTNPESMLSDHDVMMNKPNDGDLPINGSLENLFINSPVAFEITENSSQITGNIPGEDTNFHILKELFTQANDIITPPCFANRKQPQELPFSCEESVVTSSIQPPPQKGDRNAPNQIEHSTNNFEEAEDEATEVSDSDDDSDETDDDEDVESIPEFPSDVPSEFPDGSGSWSIPSTVADYIDDEPELEAPVVKPKKPKVAKPKPKRPSSPTIMKKKITPSPRKGKGKQKSVLQFLIDSLRDKRYNPSLIKWTDQDSGVFKLVKGRDLAKVWSDYRNREVLKYEFFARAIRHYYTKNMLRRYPGKKLMYQFLPASNWKKFQGKKKGK